MCGSWVHARSIQCAITVTTDVCWKKIRLATTTNEKSTNRKWREGDKIKKNKVRTNNKLYRGTRAEKKDRQTSDKWDTEKGPCWANYSIIPPLEESCRAHTPPIIRSARRSTFYSLPYSAVELKTPNIICMRVKTQERGKEKGIVGIKIEIELIQEIEKLDNERREKEKIESGQPLFLYYTANINSTSSSSSHFNRLYLCLFLLYVLSPLHPAHVIGATSFAYTVHAKLSLAFFLLTFCFKVYGTVYAVTSRDMNLKWPRIYLYNIYAALVPMNGCIFFPPLFFNFVLLAFVS